MGLLARGWRNVVHPSADGMMGGGASSCGRVLHIWVNPEAMLIWLSFLPLAMFALTAQRMVSLYSVWGSPAPS